MGRKKKYLTEEERHGGDIKRWKKYYNNHKELVKSKNKDRYYRKKMIDYNI